MDFVEGLVGDYHDNCWDWQLDRWINDPIIRNIERLRIMDYRKEYISETQFLYVIEKAKKLRNIA